ncbi:MAG: FAD-dependent monooxygenase [Myxococcaceae bacterium]|nr:FAD-dependent monooxygenase [Myxococcaceae bacterium]
MKALIVGGGIAGPVAAMALQRVGIEPVVFEAHPRAADGVGAFLTVAVNGLQALRTLGIEPSSLPGFATPRFAMHLGDGRPIAELANGPVLPDGTVSLTLERAGLYAALRDEAVRRGVRFAYGKRLDRVEGEVTAWFTDGTCEPGDLLIGADGLKSTVRSLIDPRAPKAEFIGLLNCGGYAKGLSLPGPPGLFHMIFGRRCFFGWVKAPDGQVWWFANPGRRVEPDAAELAGTDWRSELLELFRGDQTPAVEIIEKSHVVTGGWASYDLRRVPVWRRGRMVIIGDAAHAASPSSGQGASMAIEDAVVLARSLQSRPSVEEAFADYEQRRRARVERVVAHGRRNGSGKAPGPVGRALRDLMLPMVFRWLHKNGAEQQRWIYEYRVAA